MLKFWLCVFSAFFLIHNLFAVHRVVDTSRNLCAANIEVMEKAYKECTNLLTVRCNSEGSRCVSADVFSVKDCVEIYCFK
jgi:hypothetical protein